MQSSGISAYSNNLPAQARNSGAAGANGTRSITNTNAVEQKQGDSPEKAARASITSRAARLATLNQEFDLAADEFCISESFLRRMAELALIRGDEAAVLIQRLPQHATTEPQTEPLKVLEDFLQQLADTLSSDPKREHLVQVLRDTKVILEHMEISQERSHDAETGTTLAALGLHFSAEDAPQIPERHYSTLEDVRTAMVVAWKLNPLNHNSSQLNTYARVSGNML